MKDHGNQILGKLYVAFKSEALVDGLLKGSQSIFRRRALIVVEAPVGMLKFKIISVEKKA